jgi:outer membrane receptor protein involved in Fe transport
MFPSRFCVSTRRRFRQFSLASLVTLAPAVFAQVANPPPATAPAAPAADRPVAGQPVAPMKEDVVELSPFTVSVDGSDSYTALNTNSVTRFRQELAKLPVSADVFTEKFMEDIAAVSIEEMVVEYGTGTGVGGSNPSGTAEANRPGDRAANVNIKIRGLDSGQMRVNSFGAGGIDDTFTVERVDVVRGPQSLLNGGVGGGGVTNSITKRARFNSHLARAQFRVDDNGSVRGVLDYGIGNKLIAIRLAAMNEDNKYSRALLRSKSEGYYGQIGFMLTKNTTLRFEGSVKKSDTINSNTGITLNAPARTVAGVTTPADPRNGQRLRLLVAQNNASDILGGAVNWDTADSFRGVYFGQDRDNVRYEGSLEHKFGNWGTLELAAMYDLSSMDRAETNDFTNLTAPLRNNNPHNTWAVGFTPANTHESFTRRGYRANFATDFELFNGRAKTQAVIGTQYETVYNRRRQQTYFLADANGNAIVNDALINNTNIGRTIIPVQWFALTDGPATTLPFPRRANSIVASNGSTYVLGERIMLNQVPPAPNNPLGARGTGTFWDQYNYIDSSFAAFSTDWFDDQFTTLLGYRLNNVENKRYERADFKRSTSQPGSINLGANFKLGENFRPYYGYSNAYNPPDIVQFGPDGEVTTASKSVGHELGVKFTPVSGWFSGSFAVYSVDSKNEQVSIPTDVRQDINPPGINGERQPTQNWINIDRKSQGAELILTAKPRRGWDSRLTLSFTDGTVGTDKKFPIFYNDQFNTNGAGGVTYSDGSPLLVTIDPSQQANPSAPRTQLTVAMMNDPASPYFAVLDPDSGRITNAAALRLNTSNAVGALVGTGRTGLPISAHQLRFTDPNGNGGFITVAVADEATSGYAQYSANFTNSFTVANGPLKGLGFGGTALYRGGDRTYAFTQVLRNTAGVVTGTERRMFSLEDSFRFNAVFSYKRKLSKRIEWTTQVNVNNMFNSYDVVILPNENTGEARTARFTAEPRTWVWTNTFSF